MKQISTIRSLLGISQRDMAQLLNVHRSQFSMFESGQRDLPREAKIRLAPMLAQATQANLKHSATAYYPDKKTQEYLKGLLEENELQRAGMARRVQNTKTLHQKNLAILNLTAFLTDSEAHAPAGFNKLVQSIRSKAEQTLTTCSPLLLMKYEIKSELLELEKLLLEGFISKYTNEKAVKK